MQSSSRIILPLDVPTEDKAVAVVTHLGDHVGVYKVGFEILYSAGIRVLDQIRSAGAKRIFLDAKLHDIPNTVAAAMRAITRLNVWSVTLHASGGQAMLEAAREAAEHESGAAGVSRPILLAVTVLTSINDATLNNDLLVSGTACSHAVHLALLAAKSGCDGVIASPHEAAAIRVAIPQRDFLIVTPGVRPANTQHGDQARVMTPGMAVAAGADYLVVGRPILAADDPIAAAQAIAAEMESAWSSNS